MGSNQNGESKRGEGMSEYYQFDANDDALLGAAVMLLKKAATADTTTPAQLVSVAKLQHVFSVLPRVTSGVDVSVLVACPRRHFGEIITHHWFELAVEGNRLEISSGGHFYQPSTGGDSFTTMSWTALPGELAELDDYRESLWMVPDVRSFPEGVESINLASGGYSIEVTDNDNALLEHDGQAEDDKAGGEADERVGDEDDAERLADDQSPRNWSITPVRKSPTLQGPGDTEEELEEDAPGDDPQQAGVESQQATLFPERAQPGNLELYRRGEMIELAPEDWHIAVLIFREMGWAPARHLETYTRPLTFVPQREGEAMQCAGRSLFARLEKEPRVSTSVQMDLGLFYRLTEFVGEGAFIVARPGAYATAMAEDF
jgi:hypothetical protein